MLANHLASILSGANEDSAKDLCYKFDEKIESYANGDLDHALDTITLLWELAKAGGLPPPAPPDEMPHVSHLTSSFPEINLVHRRNRLPAQRIGRMLRSR